MSSNGPATESAWRRLRSGGEEAKGISIPTIASDVYTTEGAVRYALGLQGEARLLVPIGMHERLGDFADSPSLRVVGVTLEENQRPSRFIDLTCMVPELDSVFSEVAEELIKRINEGSPAQNAVRTTLQDFRALLLNPPSKKISESEIIGLVGELLVLCRLLSLDQSAASTWRGPTGERHDFRRGGHSIEVKATTRVSDLSVSISAIDQLDPPAGGSLTLSHLVLERDANGQHSVASLAEEAFSRSSEPELIAAALGNVGCLDSEAEVWNRLSFNEEAFSLYAVDEGFPRITAQSFRAGSLPEGIERVEYLVNLALATDFLIKDDAIEVRLRRVAS